jgi:ribosomal-protein-serine acetyltransferase
VFSLPLRGGALLRPLEIRHAEEFAAHMDRAREHIRPWVGASFVTEGPEAARATLLRYAERQAADGPRLFGIWADGTLRGGVMFTAFDAASGSCELGCWLEPGTEGRGLVTQACGILLHHAFRERGMHRAAWQCRADNVRSAAVAERLGMTLEGVSRETWSYGGTRYDTSLWAVLAREYPPRPAA